MSKKNNTAPAAATGKHHRHKTGLFPIALVSGDWKDEFSEYEYSVMIAEALNYCVYNEEMNISGYLLTRRRLYLVLKTEYVHINSVLLHFYDKLRKEIQHAQRIKKEIEKALKHPEATLEKPALFVRYPLQNEYLVKLITGRKVELPYSDPHLQRLKDEINKANFCSAIDYTGAKGPVVVTLLKQDEHNE